MLAFTIGGFFAGLMGGFYAQYISALDPTAFGFLFTIYILIYMIVGGAGQLRRAHHRGGASSPSCPRWRGRSKSYMPLLFAAILMVIIFLMPEGLVGLPRQAERGPSAKRSKGADPMLQVEGLTKNFGGLAAVNAVDMSIQPGELVGLIGPNGAGKTTFFNLLTGYIRPSCGHGDLRRQGTSPARSRTTVAARGMVRSFQQDNVFADFTVLENLRAGCAPQLRASTSGRRSSRRRAPGAGRARSERRPRRSSSWSASSTWRS